MNREKGIGEGIIGSHVASLTYLSVPLREEEEEKISKDSFPSLCVYKRSENVENLSAIVGPSFPDSSKNIFFPKNVPSSSLKCTTQ